MVFHKYLLLKKLCVVDFNAQSGDIVYGFPAVTAFLGFGKMLERQLSAFYPDIRCLRVGIINHRLEVNRRELYKTDSLQKKVHLGYTFASSRNPVEPLDKSSNYVKNSSMIVDIKGNLVVSLLIDLGGYIIDDTEGFKKKVEHLLKVSRLAGGKIYNYSSCSLFDFSSDDSMNDKSWSKLKRECFGGTALVSRADLMNDVYDFRSFINKLSVFKKYNVSGAEAGHYKLQPGWIVPVCVGFKALSDFNIGVNGSRDKNCKHCFAESIVSLGEFKMLRHFYSPDDIMWHYAVENEFYVCKGE